MDILFKVNDTCTLIEYIHSENIIDKATKEFLLPTKNTRTPLFYGLPKIHKPGCPLRNTVSGCDGPWELGWLPPMSTY